MKRIILAWVALAAITMVAPAVWANGGKGPSGTFRSSLGGMIKLGYEGEGTVSIKLKTKYCSFETGRDGSAGTFVPVEGISAHDKNNKVVLVAFYRRKKVIVFTRFGAFAKAFCKGGRNDATETYKRARK